MEALKRRRRLRETSDQLELWRAGCWLPVVVFSLLNIDLELCRLP